MSAGAASPVCPYLGMRDDPDTRFRYPSSAQGCHSTGRYAHIDAAGQSATCLTAAHLTCPRYLAATSGQAPDAAPVTVTPLAEAIHAEEVGARRPRRRTLLGAVSLALGLVLVAGVGVAIGIGLAVAGGGSEPTAPSAAPPSLAPVASPAPEVTPSSAPAASPVESLPALPSASAGAVVSLAPSPTPRPSPTLRTHVVQRGETLSSIAAQYGVTPQAIARANRLTNPNLIVTGSVLVIP